MGQAAARLVTGQWLRGPDGRAGRGVVVFASEDAAARAAQGPRSYPRDDDRAWNIEGVTVYQQLTMARPPAVNSRPAQQLTREAPMIAPRQQPSTHPSHVMNGGHDDVR
jgi:hypothetical protein